MTSGAAASHLGPDAQAAVVTLNKDAGRSHGKIAACPGRLFGIARTRGACAQVVPRASERRRPAYAEVRQRLTNSAQVTPDETGWRVGGSPPGSTLGSVIGPPVTASAHSAAPPSWSRRYGRGWRTARSGAALGRRWARRRKESSFR